MSGSFVGGVASQQPRAEVVPFYGDELVAVRGEGGKVWVSLRRLCENLGVAVEVQLRKIKGKPWACMTEMVMHDVDGRQQVMAVVDLDTLPGWLFSVNAGKVKPEVRDKLVRYQREAAKVLADHFFKRVESPPQPAGVDTAAFAQLMVLAIDRMNQLCDMTLRVVDTLGTAIHRAHAAPPPAQPIRLPSNAEKRQLVVFKLLSQEGEHKSARQIARECGVSDTFVARVRRQLNGDEPKPKPKPADPTPPPPPPSNRPPSDRPKSIGWDDLFRDVPPEVN